MRVLYVIDGLWVGGTERSLAELLPHLPKVGVEPSVFALRRRTRGVQAAVERMGVPVVYGQSTGALALSRELRQAVEDSTELVHAALYRSSLVSRLARPGSGVPLVNSIVNTPYAAERRVDPDVPRRLWAARLVDIVTGRLAVDRFHAVSEAARSAAIRDQRIPPERIATVHRGRDLAMFAAARTRRDLVRRELGLDSRAPVVLCVGRQDFQKNLELAVEAFGIVQGTISGASLLLAGREGTASAQVAGAIAALPEPSRVLELGHRDDVPDLMGASDLLLFPSRFEGLPGTLIEAMAARLPVIASGIPQNREVGGEGEGVQYVDSVAPADYARAAARVLASAELQVELGNAAARRAERRFAVRHSAEQMRLFYDEVLAAAGGSRRDRI